MVQISVLNILGRMKCVNSYASNIIIKDFIFIFKRLFKLWTIQIMSVYSVHNPPKSLVLVIAIINLFAFLVS